MKTLVIFSNTSWNIYNFRKNLIKNLLKNYNVVTISGKDKYSKKITKITKSYFLNIDNRSINVLTNFFEILKFRNIIKKYPNSILLNFTNKSIIIGTVAVFFYNMKVLNVITGLGHAFLQKNFFAKIIIKLIYTFIIFRSNFLIVQNKYDKKYFENKLFAKNKVKLIYGSGIDSKKFNSIKKIKNKKFKTFLYVGRIVKEKGIFNYLEAAKYFYEKKYKNIIFKIAGELDHNNLSKEEYNTFKNFLKIKNLKYIGFNNKIKNLYDKSDCIILPSYREGLSKTLLEATAMGKFVICSNVPGCNEVILNNYNGFLVESDNTQNLIFKIKKFLHLKPEKLSIMEMNSKKRTYKLFRDKIIIKNYKNLINVK